MKYSEKKMEQVQQYPSEDILKFINEIKTKEGRQKLNEILEAFIPTPLKNTRDNSKKFGKETKENFIQALKGDKKGFYADSKKKHKISAQDKAFGGLLGIHKLWLFSNPEFQTAYDEEFIVVNNITDEEFEIDSADFLNFLIGKNKISKETLENFYKFGPIDNSEEINSNLEKYTKTRLDIILDLSKNGSSIDEHKIDEMIEKNNEICKKLNEREQEIDLKSREISKLNEALSKIEKSDFGKMKECLLTQLKEKDNELQEKNNEINVLQEKRSDFNALENKVEQLMSENKTLKRIQDFKVEDLNKKLEDKEFGKTLLSLILANRTASKISVKKLGLKEALLEEGSKYYEQEFEYLKYEYEKLIEEKSKLEQKIQELKTQATALSCTPSISQVQHTRMKSDQIFTYEGNGVLSSIKNADKFLEEYIFELNKSDIYAKKRHYHINENNFIILDDRNDIDLWCSEQNCGIKPLNVFVEYNWQSVEDWFGKFENGVFIPSKTMVADYYNFVRETKELPLGVIIFHDFDKILPEIYLETFIQSIENHGYYDLLHPNICIDKDSEKYKRIYKLDKLKFVFIKKSEKENVFNIPKAMLEKYELRISDETI